MLIDRLSAEYLSTLLAIEESEEWSFGKLVEISGLRPDCDFRHCDLSELDLRGEDLRGFDFTGADLTGCLISAGTIIDETTILADADVDWQMVERQPIHQKMLQIDKSRGQNRKVLLHELEAQYESPRHIHQYIKSFLSRTDSIESFFDGLDVFDARSQDDLSLVGSKLIALALSTIRRTGKKRQSTLSPTSFSYLLQRLAESDNKLIGRIYSEYLVAADTAGTMSLNPNVYEVDSEFRRFVASVEAVTIDRRPFGDLPTIHPSSTLK